MKQSGSGDEVCRNPQGEPSSDQPLPHLDAREAQPNHHHQKKGGDDDVSEMEALVEIDARAGIACRRWNHERRCHRDQDGGLEDAVGQCGVEENRRETKQRRCCECHEHGLQDQ